MRPLLVIKDKRFCYHPTGAGHLESPKRMAAIHSVFEHPSVAGRWTEIFPRHATREELEWVHTPEYVARVADTAGRPLTSFDMDTQTTEKSYDTARLAVGAVFALIDAISTGEASRGFACIRPPGHHAEPDRSRGFCIFNNVALGAEYLRRRYGFSRVMIIDIDLHHGNGTQTIFYETDEVLYVSLHQYPGFPGTGSVEETGRGKGKGFSVNVPLTHPLGDQGIARILFLLLNPLAKTYRPDFILISFGFDLYAYDPLAAMKVTPRGYALATFLLLDIADKFCSGRILFAMEGGYSPRGIRDCGLRVVQELCDVSTLSARAVRKATGPSKQSKDPDCLRQVIEVHKEYWNILR